MLYPVERGGAEPGVVPMSYPIEKERYRCRCSPHWKGAIQESKWPPLGRSGTEVEVVQIGKGR